MTETDPLDDITPETLMGQFHGPGFSKMILVTVLVHVVVILGASVPFLMRSILGEDTASLSKEERVKNAVADATSSLQKIAEQHGLSPQDISDQFVRGASRTSAAKPMDEPKAPPEDASPKSAAESESPAPKSAIEQTLEQKAVGPSVPSTLPDIAEEEDLFK